MVQLLISLICLISVSTPTQTLPMMSTMPMGPSQQAGFLFRSVWLPLIVTFPTGQSKSTLYVSIHVKGLIVVYFNVFHLM